MRIYRAIILFLLFLVAIFMVSCAGGLRASSSPTTGQQLDFETLGDDWGNSEERAEDGVEIESEVPSLTA